MIFEQKSGHNEAQFYQIKLTPFEYNDNPGYMVQLLDISKNVLLEKQMFENKVQEISHAFASHELRNPLNSIIAQAIERQNVYKYLERLLKEEAEHLSKQEIVTSTLKSLDDLIENESVQESSQDIMQY